MSNIHSLATAESAASALADVLKTLGFTSEREFLDTPIRAHLTDEFGYTKRKVFVARIRSYRFDGKWLILSMTKNDVMFCAEEPREPNSSESKTVKQWEWVVLRELHYNVEDLSRFCACVNYTTQEVVHHQFFSFEFIRP